MHETIQNLLSSGVQVLDGAWGTQFQLKGLPMGQSPDFWNIDQPEKVLEVAKSYVDAGSDIIITNTFGSSALMLAKSGQEARVHELNEAGVRLSKQAAGNRAKVFASMGPTGYILMMGEVTEDEMFESFRLQAEGMKAGGADGIVVETMSDPEEAAIAIRAAKTTGLPVVGCMVFDSGENCDMTMMGTTVEDAAAAMLNAGADVIGSNCGRGIEYFLDVCRRLYAVSGEKVWIKANRGLPEVVNGETVYKQTPEEFASFIPELIANGAGFVGGCCGTSPEIIRAVRATVDALK